MGSTHRAAAETAPQAGGKANHTHCLGLCPLSRWPMAELVQQWPLEAVCGSASVTLTHNWQTAQPAWEGMRPLILPLSPLRAGDRHLSDACLPVCLTAAMHITK